MVECKNNIDFATSGNDGFIKLWSLARYECLNTLNGHMNLIYKMIWNPIRQCLISGSTDCFIRLWNLQECIS